MNFDDLLTEEAKQIIKDTLEIDKDEVNEAFVAQSKNIDLKTDFLSPANVQNHVNLYKDYVEKFNRASAGLDSEPLTYILSMFQ
jgi:hypothetical protein